MTHHEGGPAEELMTPGEVAALFRVDRKTVNRWARTGRIRSLVTPGGHHRYFRAEILLLAEQAKAGGQVV